MIKWSKPKDRYDLPNDPGPLTRAWWFIEDWWRELGWDERALFGLAALALVLMIYTIRYAP